MSLLHLTIHFKPTTVFQLSLYQPSIYFKLMYNHSCDDSSRHCIKSPFAAFPKRTKAFTGLYLHCPFSHSVQLKFSRRWEFRFLHLKQAMDSKFERKNQTEAISSRPRTIGDLFQALICTVKGVL